MHKLISLGAGDPKHEGDAISIQDQGDLFKRCIFHIDHLESILNEDAAGEEKCLQILSLAQAAGSKDDLTVILACRD